MKETVDPVERVFVAVLLAGALALAALNATAKPKEGTPREDAFARQVERIARIPDDAPYKRALGAWLAVSCGACGFVGVRLARRLRRGEKLDDSTSEPPPWTVIDFTLVFILQLAGQQAIGASVRPLVVLDDGRRLEVAAPVASISFGTQVPVPGATGESAAIVHSGEDLVFRVPPVHEAAPPVFLNGKRLPPGMASEHVLRRGDRFDVGGVRGVLYAPTDVEYLAAVGASSLVAPILVLIAVRLRGGRPRDVGLGGFSSEDVLRGVVGYAAMVPGTFVATILASVLCRAFGVSFHEHPLLRRIGELDAGALGMLLLVAAVIAPIAEEILFRGFLLRALRRPIPSRAGAVLASSFFFAAFHPGLSSLLPILWVGSAFALLFTTSKRGSLLPAIVCHALFNAVNILLQWGLVRAS